MSGVRHAGRVQPFLVQRARDDAIGPTGDAFINGVNEQVVGRAPGVGGDFAETHRRQVRRRRIDARDAYWQPGRIADDNGLTVFVQLRPRLRHDLRADPGDIAERDEQGGFVHGVDSIMRVSM